MLEPLYEQRLPPGILEAAIRPPNAAVEVETGIGLQIETSGIEHHPPTLLSGVVRNRKYSIIYGSSLGSTDLRLQNMDGQVYSLWNRTTKLWEGYTEYNYRGGIIFHVTPGWKSDVPAFAVQIHSVRGV
ncbi:peptidase inhibitor family I36 protein [Nocardia vulneris]|uniref:peptidase inhibitor family I36 protein n=1 Tax=Nocardia vulneris TaxID=1141657 RepID=UPI0030D49897